MSFFGATLALIQTISPPVVGQLCLTGTVTQVTSQMQILHDGDAYFALNLSADYTSCTNGRPGDVIAANCLWIQNEIGRKFLVVKDARVIGRSTVPAIRDSSITDILTRRRFYEHLRIRGRVTGVTEDEIDSKFTMAVVRDPEGEATVTVPLNRKVTSETFRTNSLLHAELEITGRYFPIPQSARYFVGPIFYPDDYSAIRIVSPAPQDIFDLPQLLSVDLVSPAQVAALGLHTLRGTVVATWGRNNLILRDDLPTFANSHRVELAIGTPCPKIGSEILVVGRPATDTYRLNLSEATYRELARPDSPAPQEGRPFQLSDIFIEKGYAPRAYGQPIRLKGRITALPAKPATDDRMIVSAEGRSIRVDVSTCPDALGTLSPGCLVELTGVCLLDTDNWRPDAPLPKIRELVVIVRSPGDITNLARPPWWTAGRLFGVICGLLALVLVILIWNRTLNRTVVRRSRELLREQSARNASELRIGERTRLAVELHDTLSQNLVGVACQITAAQNAVGTDDDSVRERLDAAERTLESCRTELRQVLSDLRSDALELPDFNDALRLVLRDLAENAAVLVRFGVPRKRLLDTTAHAILRIVRELAGNAVRHGGATVVKVAGALDRDKLVFSVRENGTGFDPANRPGPLQGHFGLEGIRARVSQFGGTFHLESAPGKGSYATVSIPLHKPDAPSA